AGWKLMRWRDESDPRAIRETRGIQAVAIDGDSVKAGAGRAENFSCTLILGIFDSNTIAALEKEARGEVEGLLRAVDDVHLRWVAGHGARTAEGRGRGLGRGQTGNRRPLSNVAYLTTGGVAHQRRPPPLPSKGSH